MYTLFNSDSGRAPLHLEPANLPYLLSLHRQNLQVVTDYYQQARYAVSSNHFLVSLILNLPGMGNMELQTYRDLLVDMTEELAQTLYLTSAVGKGKPRYPGKLLGTTGTELYLAVSSDFNLDTLSTTWSQVSSLRYLWHPVTSFNIDRLLGKPISDETGYSVLLIDIPLLGCQYQLWKKENALVNPEQSQTIMHFVAGYVLTNALKSFMDIAWFNSYLKRLRGLPLYSGGDNHPFYLNPYTLETTVAIDKILTGYSRSKVPFTYFLEGIEGFTAGNLRTAIELPTLPHTRGIIAVLILARLPVIEFLLAWNQHLNKKVHGAELSKIRISLKAFNSDKLIELLGDDRFQQAVKLQLEEQIIPFL